MTAQIIRGNALNLPLADDSVDLVVTSPPYFGLRSYQDGGEHYDGQIGAEATPAEFVDALIAATREMVRVVKPSGSIWVNLGDKYNAYNGGRGPGAIQDNEPRQSVPRGNGLDVKDVRPKSLIGIPWRYALRCIDDLGLILRAEVIWSKPNGLPESVTDRVRRSHEQWFHFTLNPRYYSAVDEVREEYAPGTAERYALGYTKSGAALAGQTLNGVLRKDEGGPSSTNPLGKLPGSVWTIPTEPLRVPDHLGIDHFAAFPTEWPRRIITGWSPRGVCVECGEGRRPVAVQERTSTEALRPAYGAGNHGTGSSTLGPRGVVAHITGEACACACRDCGGSGYATTVDGRTLGMCNTCEGRGGNTAAPTTPGVVLDPFGGTGTTALVADALGRHGISVDMSADYCRLATWRTNDPKQRAKAARKPFTPAAEQVDGQASLLELIEEASA